MHRLSPPKRDSGGSPLQVVGVFPGARMNDGTEEELDVDVDLLNWEDGTGQPLWVKAREKAMVDICLMIHNVVC